MTVSERDSELIVAAQPFYDDTLAYHGWSHAEQVMEDSSRIIREMGNVGLAINEDLLLVAAAWHDAGHEDDRANEFDSKEHYAVQLLKDYIAKDLDDEKVAVLERAILATRYKVERTTPEEIILHYADIANMGYEYERFISFSIRLWREYGAGNWDNFVTKAEEVILQSALEAERELPLIGLPINASDSFPVMARVNVARLKQEVAPR